MIFDCTPVVVEKNGQPWLLVYASDIEAHDILAKADNPNERWITMHPHGDKDAKGVPVKIKVNPDGTAHVLSGPGELRGLRLTRLASPEELDRRKAERAEKKEAQKREQAQAAKVKAQSDLEESARNPEYAQQLAQQKIDEQRQAQERTERLSDLSAQMQDLHRQLLEQAADLTGDSAYTSDRAAAAMNPDEYKEYKKKLKGEAAATFLEGLEGPDDLTDEEKADFQAAKGAGAVIASRNVRQISAGLKALRRDIIGKLVKDGELREAVLGDGDEVDMPEERPAGGPGYTRNVKQKAAEHGYSDADAKDDADRVFSERMHALDDMGQSERANAITAMREGTLRRARVERGLKSDDPADDGSTLNTPAPVREVDAHTVTQHAGKVRDFLKLHSELQALEKQHRAVLLGRDPDATPTEKAALELADLTPVNGAEVDSDVQLVDDDFARKLDAEIKDAAKADITRAFLDAAYEDEPEHEGQADSIIRRQMQAHIGAGAHAHLTNAALAALGHEGIDRTVVDALGVDAAAQLVAYAIQQDADDPESVRTGLARHHDESSIPRMQDAMQFAQAARADAAEIELPPITSATDSAVIRDLQKQRKEAIATAHEALGSALGAVEAGAALNLALKGQAKDKLTVRFGADSTKAVATQLRALGLDDSHYDLHRTPLSNQLIAEINSAGMNALTNSLSPEQASLDEKLRAIKRGDHDQPDYLPAGFMARNPSDLTDDPALPSPYRQDADWTAGPGQAARDVAASMTADGYKPSEIMRHLLDTVSADCPPEHVQDFSKAVHDLIPFYATESRTSQDGTPYTAFVARDVDNDPAIAGQLQQLSQAWMQKNHPGETDFHSQNLNADPHTREALFRAIAERPALQAAFTPPGDLGGSKEGREKARAVKDYFFTQVVKDRLGGKKPREFDEQARAAQNAALEKLGQEPDKWGGDSGGGMFDMFSGNDRQDKALTLSFSPHATPEQQVQALSAYGLTPEHYQLKDGQAVVTEAGKARLTVPAAPLTVDGTEHSPEIISGGLDSLNPQWVKYQRDAAKVKRLHPTLSDIWGDFTQTMRGPQNAYAAVQEVMQGDLLTRFTHHHAALGGQQLRVSKQTARHWERRLAATDPDEADRIRARDRSVMDQVRQRGQDGKYLQMGEGGVLSAVQEHIEKQARQANMMGNLFGLDGGKAGGEVTGKTPADLDVGAHERISLGRSAEGTLSHLLNGSRWGIKPTDAPNFLIPGLNWGKGTKHVTKQRLIKMLLESGRVVGWLGAGSGKTGNMLGAFTQAHAEGRARKALYVVPSIVRNQFGEEAAKFTEPGRYTWHAEDASFEERKKHYQGDTHMLVTTHQTFRDDMLKLMAEHHGVPHAQVTDWFTSMSRPERARVYQEAMHGHGIPMDMISVDEAHDFLDRAGKKDSTMSKVLDAALDNHKFKSLWTGSPVKNDASEIHSWLSKVDPARFGDRDEFMRRYGVNTRASAEALQRLVDSYSVIDSVRPDIARKVVWGHEENGQEAPLPLSAEQQQALKDVNAAFERASSAQRRGDVDVDAARILSPRSFEGQPASEHRAVAARLQSALGTLKHSAVGRVVNEFDPQHNAKVQHVLKLAGERRGKGGVIFARNRKSIELLKSQLEAQGHKVGVINGASSTDEKGRVRQNFDSGAVDIVLCSDAGATGANLQGRGRYLINYDLPLTMKTLEQRNARIDRLGQKEQIELHHLLTDTAYDRDNRRRLERKGDLGGILQGEYRDMDDTGLAAHIRRAQAERNGAVTPAWEEPLTPDGPAIHENARPAPRLWEPEGGSDAPPTTDTPARSLHA